MQYKVRIILKTGRGDPVVSEIDVPEMPPAPCTPEDAQCGRFEEARELRVLLGPVSGLRTEHVARMNGFGQILLREVGEQDASEILLSKNHPVLVDGFEVTCEQVAVPAPHRGDDRGLLLRLWHWLTRARCQKCFFFDQRQAVEWRDRITHTFGGISGGADGALHERMNHDIMMMEAAAYGLPDIPLGQFGYCSARWVGLHGVLHPCCEYRRRKEG